MDECPVELSALPALFDPGVPNNPALWAVLKGRHTGRAWVDDVHNPSQCVLRTDAALTFSSHHIRQTFLEQAIAHVRRIDQVWLVEPPSQPPPPEPTRIVPRIEFYDCDSRDPVLADLRRRVPAGFDIHPIDRSLLERCEWRSDMEFYCGSLDNFLAHGIGLCLMRGDDIIVEAYASSLGETKAEIGAVTRAAYRGRGYAPLACAYLIDACARQGYEAYWSCDADNLPSIRVARKLGFRRERAYRIFEYDRA